LAVILAREVLDEPLGKFRGHPAVQMQYGLPRHILAGGVTLDSRLSADVKAGYLPLKHDQARMQLERLARFGVDTLCQAPEPPGACVVNRKVRGNSHPSQL